MAKLTGTIFFILVFYPWFNSNLYGQNFWQQTSGPEGGSVSCIHVGEDDLITIGLSMGSFGPDHSAKGIYQSNDKGLNWSPIDLPDNKSVVSLVVDTLKHYYAWIKNAGIYKSTNSGLSWFRIHGNFDITYDSFLGLCKNNYVVLANKNGIYLSMDNGISWRQTNFKTRAAGLYIDENDIIYTFRENGNVFRSSDYGMLWHAAWPGLRGQQVNILTKTNDDVLYVGAESGIFRSADNGLNWRLLENSPRNVISICNSYSGDNYYVGTRYDGFFIADSGNNWIQKNNGLKNLQISSIKNLSTDEIVIGTAEDGFFYSSDKGDNWINRKKGIINTSIAALLQNKGKLFAGSENGRIYFTTDNGSNWKMDDSIYTHGEIYCFGKSSKSLFFGCFYSPADSKTEKFFYDEPINPDYFADKDKGSNRIYKSTDDGLTWKVVGDIYIKSMTSYFDSSSGKEYILAAAPYLGVVISVDDGETWQIKNNGMQQNPYITEIKCNSSGALFAAANRLLYRSTNFGDSWEIVFDAGETSYHMVVNVARNNFVYIGTDWGTIHLSKDGGNTWINRGQNLSVNRLNSITTDALNNVMIGNWWGQIFMSNDDGESWEDINSGTIGGPVLNLYSADEGVIFFGPSGGGVFKNVISTFTPPIVKLQFPEHGVLSQPTNISLKWVSSSTATKYHVQLSPKVTFDPLNLVVDTVITDTTFALQNLLNNVSYSWRVSAYNQYGWNLWSIPFRFTTGNLTDVDSETTLPLVNQLSQNFPNPFNPATTIKYQIRESSIVSLKIYDVLGTEVLTLVDGYQSKGKYRASFDGSKLPSGVYIYRIQANNYVESRKMILLK